MGDMKLTEKFQYPIHILNGRLWIFARILAAIYFCGFINYKITNGIVEQVFKNSFFEDAAQSSIHTLLSFFAILLLFPLKLKEELFRYEKNTFRFGILIAVGFPLCIFLPNIILNVYFGANFSLFTPSIENIISLTFLSLAASIEEEVVCRFVLFERLSKVLGVSISFCIQLFFFVALHATGHGVSREKFILLFIASFLLVALYKRTRSLFIVILMHFSYDFFLTLIFGGFLMKTHFVGFVGIALLGEKYSNYIKISMAIVLIGYLLISNKRENVVKTAN